MTQKFVVRLLDAENQLLGWAEVSASARPQGQRRSCPFWADRPTQFVIDQDGIAAQITIHWCDLDLARSSPPLEPTAVKAGQVFTLNWIEPVWLVPAPEKDVPLPAVTVRQSVTLTPPAGQLTSAGR